MTDDLKEIAEQLQQISNRKSNIPPGINARQAGKNIGMAFGDPATAQTTSTLGKNNLYVLTKSKHRFNVYRSSLEAHKVANMNLNFIYVSNVVRLRGVDSGFYVVLPDFLNRNSRIFDYVAGHLTELSYPYLNLST